MPRIFASATEHKYHNHDNNMQHKAHQDLRSHLLFRRHGRKHHVYIKKSKFSKLYREQETRRKIQKESSDLLDVAIGRRKLFCKYRKSCYNTGIIPNTWNINNVLPQMMSMDEEGKSSAKASMTEIPKSYDNEEKGKIGEEEMKLLCRYRRSCYEKVGAHIESALKVQVEPISFSHDSVILPTKQKSTKHIARITLRKIGERTASLQTTPTKMITGENLNEIKKKMKKRLACKYRKSCYDTGILSDLSKKPVKEEMSPMVPVQTVTSLYYLKTLCKYRKSCYKKKTEERQNSNVGQLEEIRMLDKNGSERKKEGEKEKKADKSYQKESVLESKKTTQTSPLMKVERVFETKPTKIINDKKLTKKSRISISKMEEKRMAAIKNENVEGIVHKVGKTKTEQGEEIPIKPIKKVQSAVLSTSTKRSIMQKKSPEYLQAKKKRLESEKVKEKIRIRDEKIVKKKKTLETDVFEKELTAKATEVSSTAVDEVQSTLLQVTKTIPLRNVNVYDENYNENSSLLDQTAKITQHFEVQDDHRKIETLLENHDGNFKTTYLAKKNNPEKNMSLILRCKYRKSCYKTGKMPTVERSKLTLSKTQIMKGHEASVRWEPTREQLRVRCKYRKSCYESDVPSIVLNDTAYAITTLIKHYESLQHKCKYRKSCYDSIKLDMQLDKARKMDEQRKMQKGIIEALYRKESVNKRKENEQKKNEKDEVTDGDKRSNRTKSEELKSQIKEQQYMQINQLDSQSRQKAIKLQSINSVQKIKCKYRLKCYDSVPLQQVAEEKRIENQGKLNIKDFRRANGAICNFYYISCKKQAGLPINERVPIGPNGRRLCRKKKKEEMSDKTYLKT